MKVAHMSCIYINKYTYIRPPKLDSYNDKEVSTTKNVIFYIYIIQMHPTWKLLNT